MENAKLLFGLPIVLSCLSGVASAQSLPRYNVDNYCQEVADFSGGSAMIFNGCMEMEQEAYNSLQAVWPSTPRKSRDYCDEIARFSKGSYSILQGCLAMEMDAGSNPKTFDY